MESFKRGGYQVLEDGTILDNRYTIGEMLGHGIYSMVYAADDYITDTRVAVKIFRNVPKYKKAGLYEVEILNELGDLDPDNKIPIVKMLNTFIFNNCVCIVFDIFECSLDKIASERVTDIAKELLISLDFLHKNGFIHTDLKPENILIDGDKIVLADLGSVIRNSDKKLAIVSTKEYRAPEVIDGVWDYSIDLWSLGCILTESLTESSPINSPILVLIDLLLVVNPKNRITAKEAIHFLENN